jgi:excisionase family DNA binding protein
VRVGKFQIGYERIMCMKLLKATEVADMLQVSLARVYELARRRTIPTIKLGERQVRFDEVALREWMTRSSEQDTMAQGGGN